MEGLRILRTGAGSAVAPFVIQALKEARDVYVVAADMDPSAVGFHFADAAVSIPPASASDLIDRLLEICRQHRIDILFPDIDEELLPIAAARGAFEELGVRVLLSGETAIRIATDKLMFSQRLEELGIPAPAVFPIDDPTAVTFPAFIKPRHGRGSQNAHRVDDATGLNHVLSSVPNPIVQAFVEGIEYTVDALASLEGEYLYSSVRERVQTDSGISTKGRTTVAPLIEAHVEEIINALGLAGPVCIQCIVDSDGVPYFTDCNPRLGGGTVLSVAAGAPIVSDIVRMLRGETIEGKKDFVSGLTMKRFWNEVYVDPLQAVEAVIFDLDYTLYDADTYNDAALSSVAARGASEIGLDREQAAATLFRLRAELGPDHPHLFDEWLTSHNVWSSARVSTCIESWHSYIPQEDFVLYQGVREMLQSLRANGIKLGIVTDGNMKMQATKLRALHIDDLFDVVVLNSVVGAPKPDRKGLIHAMEQLEVAAADALFVGDHPTYDIVMARRAGVRSVRVLTGPFATRPHHLGAIPDAVIENVTQLASRVTR